METGQRLGKGSFGQVREARGSHNNKFVAVKAYSETHGTKEEALRNAMLEVMLSLRAAHPRVVALLDAFVDADAVRVVFEHGGQSLHGLVAAGYQRQPVVLMGPSGAQLLWQQCLEGLAWIHGRGIIHADLSTALSHGGSIGLSGGSPGLAGWEKGDLRAMRCGPWERSSGHAGWGKGGLRAMHCGPCGGPSGHVSWGGRSGHGSGTGNVLVAIARPPATGGGQPPATGGWRPLDPLLGELSGVRVRLADFGAAVAGPAACRERRSSRAERRQQGVAMGTIQYRAPEVFMGTPPGDATPAVDISAAGCLLAFMILGQHLFSARTQVGMIWAILRQRGGEPTGDLEALPCWPEHPPHFRKPLPWPGRLPEALGPGGEVLLGQVLALSPGARPPAQTCLAHEAMQATWPFPGRLAQPGECSAASRHRRGPEGKTVF